MTPVRFDLPEPQRLAESAFSPDTRAALLALEEAMFHWHRQVLKGELTGRLLAETAFDLEPALFQGLTAIARVQKGAGRDAPAQPTVGMLAEEMAVDPSRASRIASTLIERGYIARAAAQEDGRKSVLWLTEKGRGALVELRDRKWARLMEVFGGWSEADIACFSRLFERYSAEVMGDEGG